MITVEKGFVLLDLDGTISDQNDYLRPYVIQFILALRKDNIIVYLWSAGGADYARGKARMWFIDDLFDGFLVKSIGLQMYLDGSSVVIDNDDLATTGKLVKVPTYDRNTNPDDDVFRDLLLQHLHTEG